MISGANPDALPATYVYQVALSQIQLPCHPLEHIVMLESIAHMALLKWLRVPVAQWDKKLVQNSNLTVLSADRAKFVMKAILYHWCVRKDTSALQGKCMPVPPPHIIDTKEWKRWAIAKLVQRVIVAMRQTLLTNCYISVLKAIIAIIRRIIQIHVHLEPIIHTLEALQYQIVQPAVMAITVKRLVSSQLYARMEISVKRGQRVGSSHVLVDIIARGGLYIHVLPTTYAPEEVQTRYCAHHPNIAL